MLRFQPSRFYANVLGERPGRVADLNPIGSPDLSASLRWRKTAHVDWTKRWCAPGIFWDERTVAIDSAPSPPGSRAICGCCAHRMPTKPEQQPPLRGEVRHWSCD